MTDLIAGQMQMTIEGSTTGVPQIQAGKVRPLAVTSTERLADIPDVPTMSELGYRGFPPASWTGVLAPAGTPAAIVDKVNAAINAGLASPELKETLAKVGAEPASGSPQDFAAFISSETKKWSAIAKTAGVTME